MCRPKNWRCDQSIQVVLMMALFACIRTVVAAFDTWKTYVAFSLGWVDGFLQQPAQNRADLSHPPAMIPVLPGGLPYIELVGVLLERRYQISSLQRQGCQAGL
jgi:hypothetical protein